LEINQRNTDVVLVWDGKKGVQGGYTSKERDSDMFTTIVTREGLTADDYILSEIRAIVESGVRDHEVQIVTGDRGLRRLALASKKICTNAVDPVVFWRRYRPRLAGLKHHNYIDHGL
jgi:thioredoxin reductase